MRLYRLTTYRRYLQYSFGLIACMSIPITAETFTVVDVPGATKVSPAAMNNAGDIAGYVCCPTRGFVRETGGRISLFDGVPTAINDAGIAVGYFPPATPLIGSRQAFVRDAQGNMTIFDLPLVQFFNPPSGLATAISNSGDIAGYVLVTEDINGFYLGFVRDQRGDMSLFGFPLGFLPTSINARGDITGFSQLFDVPI